MTEEKFIEVLTNEQLILCPRRASLVSHNPLESPWVASPIDGDSVPKGQTPLRVERKPICSFALRYVPRCSAIILQVAAASKISDCVADATLRRSSNKQSYATGREI
jgi:hypothetical protein